MESSSYAVRVNRHEGDGWQEWSILLTKEEAYKQAREHRIWAKNSDLQWSFKIIKSVERKPSTGVVNRGDAGYPTVLANLFSL